MYYVQLCIFFRYSITPTLGLMKLGPLSRLPVFRHFLDWTCSLIISNTKLSVNEPQTTFSLLSNIYLSIIHAAALKSYQVDGWLYDHYCHYGIRIQDFKKQLTQYQFPLIELAVPSSTKSLEFEYGLSEDIRKMLLERPADAVRLVFFPQTR